MSARLDEERLRGVLDAARALVAERELSRVLGRLLDAARELTGACYAGVAILGSPNGVVSSGPDPARAAELQSLLRDAPLVAEVLAAEAPLSTSDRGGADALHSLLAVTVGLEDGPWGVLCLADEAPARFSPEDEVMLELLSGWAAIAVANARMHEDNEHRRLELERSVAALEATFEIARAVGGETRVERVLDLIADRSRALVGASGVFILIPAGSDFIVAAVAGNISTSLAGSMLPGGTSVARRVLRSGRPVRISVDDMPETSRLVLAQIGLRPRSALVVPLVFRGNNVGVIEALDRVDGPHFRDVDEHRLQAAAASAATAVATAQTVEQDRLHRSLQAAEEERGRWARELHDETLQGLGGLRMTLSSARRLDDVAALRSAIDGAVDQLGREIADLRALITELRPASLDQLGLEPALDALFERARKVYGLPVRAIVQLGSSAAGRLDPDVETTVYRVVQESLNNAARHARASQVSIEVFERADEITLRIVDDGQGFDQSLPAAGFGVVGMRERVTLAGGRLEIDSGGHGTSVSAIIPARRDGARPAAPDVSLVIRARGEP